MKSYYWLLFIFLCFNLQSWAQREGVVYNGVVYRKTMSYKTSLNMNPLALASTDNQLMLGIEQRYKKNWAYTLDAGLVFNSYYIRDVKSALGFELRPAIRYYHGRYKSEYFQAQVFYKMVDYRFHDWLGKDVVDRVPAYEKLQDFTFRKKTLSVSFMAGETIPLSERFFIDVYGGLGLRYKDQGVTEPNSVYTSVETNSRAIYGPHVWSICAPVGVKLAVILK